MGERVGIGFRVFGSRPTSSKDRKSEASVLQASWSFRQRFCAAQNFEDQNRKYPVYLSDSENLFARCYGLFAPRCF